MLPVYVTVSFIFFSTSVLSKSDLKFFIYISSKFSVSLRYSPPTSMSFYKNVWFFLLKLFYVVSLIIIKICSRWYIWWIRNSNYFCSYSPEEVYFQRNYTEYLRSVLPPTLRYIYHHLGDLKVCIKMFSLGNLPKSFIFTTS